MKTLVRSDRQHVSTVSDYLMRVILLIVILLLWELAVRLFGVERYILPPPSEVIRETFAHYNVLLQNLLVTLTEAAVGLVLAFLLGVTAALLMQLFPRIDRIAQPFVAGLQSFPKEAIAPLLVVWFGFGMASKFVIACSIAFFPVFLSTLKGLKGVPDEVIYTFLAMRANSRKILFKARLPYSLPYMIAGVRVASTLSIVGAVIGEFLGSSSGLGHLILIANSEFSVALLFACLLILGLLGIVIDIVLQRLEEILLPWHESFSGIQELAR